MQEFLLKCAGQFQLAVWSSSTPDYLHAVLAQTVPPEVRLVFVWSRDRCVRRYDPEWQEHYFVKDLRKVKRITDALLRGLKGQAKSAQDEVTASSLYDFIDHQIVRPDQQPVFFGEMAGRIVLMHYASRTTKAPKQSVKKKATVAKASSPKFKGTWIMLME